MGSDDKLLEKARTMILADEDKDRFAHIYPFTTEKISGYIDQFDLKDKSLLTVGSSSDQVINAALKGSRDITLIDINPFIKYYYYLKIAALLTLNLEEFHIFLRYRHFPIYFIKNKKVFNKELYDKIRPALSELDMESFIFWEELFKKFEPIIVRKKIFSFDEDKNKIIINSNPYLQEASYEETRRIIKDVHITFVNEDIMKAKFKRKFDNIWLSNLTSWLGSKSAMKMFKVTEALLEEDGKLLLSYIYGPFNVDLRREDAHLKRILDGFKDEELIPFYFPGINGMTYNNNSKDCALIYKKH